MHRRYTSHKQMSGEYAHLIGQPITWSEILDMTSWEQHTGKIVIVHPRTKCFTVDEENARRGVFPLDASYKCVLVNGQVIF